MPEADRLKWDAKYADRGATVAQPSPFVLRMLDQLPTVGRCMDVAGGTGRNARALAAHGLDVTIVDVSAKGLEIATRESAAAGLSIATLVHDVEDDGLPAGTWELIVDVHFLHRPLFAQWADALEPGGLLLFEHQTMRNLDRHAKPSGRWLLEEGELPGLVQGLEVIHYEECWGAADRHEARLLARRP